MEQKVAVRWLIKALTSALLAIGLCVLIAPAIRDIPPLPPLTKDDEAQPELTRYRREPIPDIVLVGSSLTHRLKEAYFLPLNVRNLATSGDSPLTGLTIISSYSRLPNIILVEANILSRDIDNSLVKRYSSTASDVSILRPIRTAVAYWNSRSERPSQKRSIEDILREPPLDHNSAVAIARAEVEYSKSDQDQIIEKNAVILARLIAQLTARGSRVYLFEMPYAANIGETHYVKTTRMAFHRVITDPSSWLRLSYPVTELRFEDHAHLDERSAVIVARAMETEILALPRPR